MRIGVVIGIVCLTLLFVGLHLRVVRLEDQMTAVLTEATVRQSVCEGALGIIQRDKFQAYAAKAEALRRLQKGIQK